MLREGEGKGRDLPAEACLNHELEKRALYRLEKMKKVLVPSEVKTLHLYGARYITLLEKVERLEIEVLVLIRGVGRVKILEFKQISVIAEECAVNGCVNARIIDNSNWNWVIGFTINGALKNFTMVRSKIRYELIADGRTRRETFKKRRTGLLKKLNELKILCDIEACGLVINGDGTQSEVWPSPNEASQVIQKFVSSSDTSNRVDQIGFLRQNLSRISKNLDKETRKVQSLEREMLLAECVTKEEVNTSNSHELHEMLRLLERKIEMVDSRMANIAPSSSINVVVRGQVKNNGKGKRTL